jgi:polysaccharide export outer membrane protein
MKMNPFRVLISLMLLTSLGGCAINSSIMFKTPKGEMSSYDSIPLYPKEDYRISEADYISFTLSTNKGTRIIEAMSGVGETKTIQNNQLSSLGLGGLTYLVRSDGYANLPVLGDVKIEKLTILQCEDTLTKLYARAYQEPFIQVTVTNKRVIIFSGNGSSASIVPLTNNNTTLMEVIALAGGIADRGKSNIIKLMRRVNDKREVYLIDLSTLDGLKFADMIVQANDYIYIEPAPQLAREALKEITPVLSLFSTALVIFTVLTTFKN